MGSYQKNKGRSSEQFVRLPHRYLNSTAWKDLSPGAAMILIEIIRRYNGSNNGEMSLSCREAAKVAHCGKGTAGKKLCELMAHGWIKPSYKSCFRNRHATTWTLTFETHHGKSPTNEWKAWVPKIKTP